MRVQRPTRSGRVRGRYAGPRPTPAPPGAVHRAGPRRSEQPLDHVQRSGDVTVIDPPPDRRQCLRLTMHRVDRAKARQRWTTERDQQLLPAQLRRVVIDRRQYPVAQRDPVDFPPALHPMWVPAGRTAQASQRPETIAGTEPTRKPESVTSPDPAASQGRPLAPSDGSGRLPAAPSPVWKRSTRPSSS